MNASNDPFKARQTLSTPLGERTIYQLDALRGIGEVSKLPYSIKVLLEACLRHFDNYVINEEHVKALASYDARNVGEQEIPFKPGRVVLQDFTGVPAVVDLAAMRAGIVRMTGDDLPDQFDAISIFEGDIDDRHIGFGTPDFFERLVYTRRFSAHHHIR